MKGYSQYGESETGQNLYRMDRRALFVFLESEIFHRFHSQQP